ncbi:BTB/POZ domain-containing protein 3-like [Mercenaria mercenaria]|uniref:BTB/POZ domain-containing protein 3-like n=1 Tax=Mercenaria mercenaria TaxID=6596 RepID=UPI00234F33A8|nr:BTB/POZ domain-containing protein 3-like [Mercenaria mercenaria]
MATGNINRQTSMQTDEVLDNWRDSKSLAGCAEQYLMKGLMSDVTFIFKKDGDKKLTAHRLILSMRSEVFEAMFFGPMADHHSEIDVEDINQDIFDLMLRYIYTDEVDLKGDTVLKCLYAARKYCLRGLVKICSDFLENSITTDNVCTLYEQAKFFDVEELKVRCYKFITENSGEVFLSEDIQKLSYESLLAILTDDKLHSEEMVQFEMALRWADGKCQSENFETSFENKRKILGEVIEKIRFPTIPPDVFVKKVVPTKILLPEDQMQLLQFMVTMTTETPGYVGKFISYPRHNSLTINLQNIGCLSISQSYGESFSLTSNFDIALLEFSAVSARFLSCKIVCKEDRSLNKILKFDEFDYRDKGGFVKPAKGNNIILSANKHYQFTFQHDNYAPGGAPLNTMRTMNHVVKFGELSVTVEEMPLNINTVRFCRV